MMFHPTAEDPTIPNAGIVRYEKGSGHPLHNHYFAQVWYIRKASSASRASCTARAR